MDKTDIPGTFNAGATLGPVNETNMARIWNKHKQSDTPLKRKVFVAMSGGVDSSVAAAMLLKEGYEVTGAFMVNYDGERGRGKEEGGNCWLPDYRDALRVAAKLGITLIKLDFTKEYNDLVLKYMFREYEAGRTPNPDVLCNKFVKFGVWLEKARELGYEKLATGHYARLGVKEIRNLKLETGGDKNSFQFPVSSFRLLQATDSNKDQTYFLHQLTQDQLKHVLFPLGEYTKPEVRVLARKWELPTAEKEESMGICFVGEVPMREFLMQKIKPKPGEIVMSDGTVIGEHQGLPFYTIGQRGLAGRVKSDGGRGDSKPLYVVDKDLEENKLVVGYEDDPLLYKKEITVKDVNWIAGKSPEFPLYCKVRLRHRQPLQSGEIRNCPAASGIPLLREKLETGEECVKIKFEQPQRAATPGQFAVFYLKDECLGGGVIQ